MWTLRNINELHSFEFRSSNAHSIATVFVHCMLHMCTIGFDGIRRVSAGAVERSTALRKCCGFQGSSLLYASEHCMESGLRNGFAATATLLCHGLPHKESDFSCDLLLQGHWHLNLTAHRHGSLQHTGVSHAVRHRFSETGDSRRDDGNLNHQCDEKRTTISYCC